MKLYTIFIGNVVTKLTAENNKEAIKLGLTFHNIKKIFDDEGNQIFKRGGEF